MQKLDTSSGVPFKTGETSLCKRQRILDVNYNS